VSRIPDAKLKDRILDVAQGLLKSDGEKGVTLRAVAEAAGTTTPTVYKRFPDKAALLLALAMRERDRYVKRQMQRRSLETAAAGYLDWAIHNPHEYELIHSEHWPKVFARETGRPGRAWAQEQLAARHGGKPQDYEQLATMLWLLLHGAATLLAQQPTGEAAEEIRSQCLASVDQILARAADFRGRGRN
jgi:AcrR family transcriptional regulator